MKVNALRAWSLSGIDPFYFPRWQQQQLKQCRLSYFLHMIRNRFFCPDWSDSYLFDLCECNGSCKPHILINWLQGLRTRKLNSALARVLLWFLSWVNSVQIFGIILISAKSILVLSSHLHPSLCPTHFPTRKLLTSSSIVSVENIVIIIIIFYY